MRQKVNRKEWVRLLDRVELFENDPLTLVLEAMHKKLDELDQAEIDLVNMGEEIADLRNEEHLPNEEAARLVHASHDGPYLVDLSLCLHPDCTRLWREA